MEPNKQAYLSPTTGLLELTVVRDARPSVAITLDLGIPNFTVFSLKFPLAENDPQTMSGLVAEAVHVLLDEVSTFMLSVGYEEEVIVQIYATVLACFKSLSGEADTNKSHDPIGQDTAIKTFQGTFKLPMAFINETYDKVVTAATKIKRMPEVRRLELSHSKPPSFSTNDAARAIRQYRTRSLKSQPNPMYVLVFDQMGRPKGTIPLGTNFKNKLLNMMYNKKASVEFSPTVKFNTDVEMKYTNVNGIPQSVFLADVQFMPEAYCGNDMALYKAEAGTYIVKFPDGRCVEFNDFPSIESLKVGNYPVPGEYEDWDIVREEQKPEENQQTPDAVDSQGKELNETDPEFDNGKAASTYDSSPEGAASRGEVLVNGYGEECHSGDPDYPMSENEAAEQNRLKNRRAAVEPRPRPKLDPVSEAVRKSPPHSIIACSCGKTLVKCRCPERLHPEGRKTVEVVGGCDECRVKAGLPKRADHIDENGFWAGEGGGASGILPICSTTKRICLAWRSAYVNQGDCWGTLGGAIQRGMSPQESAKEEMAEETGYHGGITLHPAYVFQSGTFKYHNFVGVVPSEFQFHPDPEHGWETDSIMWFTYEEIAEDMQTNAGDYHPGLITLFQHSGDLIRKLCGADSNKPEEE